MTDDHLSYDDLLLIKVCNIILDKYVLDIINDPAILIKLTISKLGNSIRGQAIRTVRKYRNNYVHNINFNPDDNTKAKYNNAKKLLEELLESTIVNTNNYVPILSDVLYNIKQTNKEYLKGKTIRLPSGQTCMFCGWNGTCAKVLVDGKKKTIPLHTKIEVVSNS